MLLTHAALENVYFQITIHDILIGFCVVREKSFNCELL